MWVGLLLLISFPVSAQTTRSWTGDVAALLEHIGSENGPRSSAELADWFEARGLGELWAVVHASKSQRKQDYNAENPRVIVVNESPGGYADFGIAYGACTESGTTRPKTTDVLEMFSFDTEAAKFTFREIIFPGPDRKPVVSEPNPTRCLGCHGQDPRPLIDAYNFWDGWIGSISRLGVDVYLKGSKEEQIANKAYARIKSSTGLRYLKWHDPTDKVLILKNFLYDDVDLETFEKLGLVNVQHSAIDGPVSHMTQLIATANFLRIKRQILTGLRRHPEYIPFAKEIFSSWFFSRVDTLSPDEVDRELHPFKLQYSKSTSSDFKAVRQAVLSTNPFTETDNPLHDELRTKIFSSGNIRTFEEREFYYLLKKLGIRVREVSHSFSQPYNLETPMEAIKRLVKSPLLQYLYDCEEALTPP